MSVPADALYTSIAARIATDPAKLGLATFLAVVPIIADFTPAVTLVAGDLTLGTGTLAKIASTVLPTTGLDPVSGQYKILVRPPAGGWTWTYDGVTPAPPQTIYGWALVDAATGAILFAVSDKLNPGILLTGARLVVDDEFSFLLIIPPLQ